MRTKVYHGHMCCGLGGGARGGLLFNKRHADELDMEFECAGGIDNNPAAVNDFRTLSGALGTVLDLFSRDQYVRFHGHEPPATWLEVIPAAVRACYTHRPHIGVMSTPCKGYTGLLSQAKSETGRYRALNELALRCLWLYLEAFADDPSEFILFENVPRIQTRGRDLLDRCIQLLDAYGYAAAETTHDCGEIGGLHQSRKRFLLVARHRAKVPPFLYEAPRRPLRAVGELLERFPLPGDPAGGPMHRVPSLQWKTWVRLAFVQAGSDWRSLNRLNVKDGVLQDYLLVPDRRNDYLGVTRWDETSGAVNGESLPTNGRFSVADPRVENVHHGVLGVKQWHGPAQCVQGASRPQNGQFSVADPRIDGHEKSVQMGVRPWNEPAGVVTGKMFAGGGPNSVADPRIAGARFNHIYKIVPWNQPAAAVTGPGGPANGAAVADPRPGWDRHSNALQVVPWVKHAPAVIGGGKGVQGGHISVADPRTGWNPGAHESKLRVSQWEKQTRSVTGSDRVGSGALSIADPRPNCLKREGDHYETGGHYGVVPWTASGYAVTGAGSYDNGWNSVADPRMPVLTEKLVCVIRALDGTWHRPFTTLELAGLQGLVEPWDEVIALDGASDSAWRERIGNAIPSGTMCEIFAVMGRTLRAAWSGETFQLSSEPVWVRPVAIAIAAAQ